MTDPAKKPDHVYLVDGSGYIFRAFHALPPLSRADGTPVNAVLGFTNMLLKLIEDTDAEYIAVIFDAGRKTFRNEIYPEYKAHRPEAPPELVPQFALIRDATRAFNVPAIEIKGYEADDLIATYASQAAAMGHDVTIVSSDKDLMQLVDDRISLFDPMKNRKIGAAEVMEKFGVGPEKVVDVQSLAGDSSDNVPGVPGIGIKTAAELINTYGDLDTLLAKAGEIKQPKRRENLTNHADLARISRDLVTLKRDVPLDVPLGELGKRGIDGEAALAFLQENGFRALIAKVQARLGEASIKASRSSGAAAASGAASTTTAQIDADPTVFSGSYELVQEEAQLISWIARARSIGAVAFDIETTSLNIVEAKLVGLSLAVAANAACYVPLAHQGVTGDLLGGGSERPQQIPMARALALLKPLLEDPSVLKIGQNIKYDMAVMARLDVHVTPIDDTMLMSYVIEGGAHGHGMDELAKLHFDYDTIKFKDVAGSGKSMVTFDHVPLDKALAYAAEDADVTWRLHHVLKPRLIAERLSTVYETIERPLIKVVADMELAGVKIDAAELGRMSQDFATRMVEIEREIHEIAGTEFNVGSPKQLGEILFDQLKLPGGKKGKTGAYGTGADVLEELTVTSGGHPLPQKILDWRQLAKLKSTYTDALPLAINAETGRVHTSFALAATSTGRLASTDPNLQNIPIRTEEGRKIRRAFVAEPGHVLMSVDYSQIELRLAAEMADIQPLKDAFRDGADIHAMTASQVFGVPVEGMDPMVRRKAKAINFGIIYGISAFGLAQQLSIPQGEAKAYIEAYFKRYPGIRDYMDRMKAFAREKGYVETLFGRRCHVPGINDKNPARRSFMERAAINAPLQGTAADIIKRAMIRMPDALAKAGLKARMLLQVHDELLFEVAEGEVEATGKVVKRVMEEAPLPARQISVPLIAEVGVGPNWAEAH